MRKLGLIRFGRFSHRMVEYARVVDTMLSAAPEPRYRRFPCVTPMWDNSARRASGCHMLTNSTPELYEHWLVNVVAKAKKQPGNDKLVFINAWNEWGEGCHLEPDQKWGRAYLEATRRALRGG
jgi:hypothetical protein